MTHLNDITKLYLDQISEKKDDSYLEPDMKKRQKNNEKARKELAKGPQMKNPHFEETKLDPVGQEDGDIDNDGDMDKSDKYLAKRRKAIGKAIKVKESFSNWRQDLSEVITDDKDDAEIKEKKVNNKIKINPKLGEAIEQIGGTLLEEIEVDEIDFIVESVYDELIEEGYAEDDVEDAIENAMEATVTFGSDTKELKKDGSQVGSKRKFLKRKAGEFLQKAKKKVGMAVAQGRVDAYNKKREVKQSAGDKARKVKQSAFNASSKAKSGVKSYLKNKAQKVVDRMSEETVDHIDEEKKPLPKNKMFRKAGNLGRDVVSPSVTDDQRQKAYGRSKKIIKTLNKANEEFEAEGYEPMTPERKLRVDRAKRGAYDKDQRAQHQGDKKEADKQFKRRMAMDSRTKMKEEASMSPQEIQLQKKKAMLDRMIAQKRQQGLNKAKKSEAPTKAMGEATEDSLRDRRMERGGVGGNQRYNKPVSNTPNTFGKKKPYDGMSALEKVKASIRAKHGDGAIMDTKKK